MSSGLSTHVGHSCQNGILTWFGIETAIMVSYICSQEKPDERMHKQPKSNMPLKILLSWGYSKQHYNEASVNVLADLDQPEVIRLFSCSAQMSMKCFMLINLKLLTLAKSFLQSLSRLSMQLSPLINIKMPLIVGIFIFISRENFMFSWVEHEKSHNLRAWVFCICPKHPFFFIVWHM